MSDESVQTYVSNFILSLPRYWFLIDFNNITRKHSNRMHTTRSLLYRGISLTVNPPGQRPPGQRPPLDRDPPGQSPPRQRPPLARDPPVNRITDMCKNITFPQLRLRVVIMIFEISSRPYLCWW